MEIPANKRYIGDGVYADYVNGMVVLTTEDGISVTNKIFLEYSVVTALLGYIDQVARSF